MLLSLGIEIIPREIYGDESLDHRASYWKKLSQGLVRCQLCPNECLIAPGNTGRCHGRLNKNGTLFSIVYGRPSVIEMDSLIKAPLYHSSIKKDVFSIATAGCNLSCQYCQNHKISQHGPNDVTRTFSMSPSDVVKRAVKHKAAGINFFYSEPTVYYEYMIDIAKLAKKNNLKTFCITAGHINEKPLINLIDYIDGFVVGLKGFNEGFYEKIIHGDLKSILNTLKVLKKSHKKTYFEIVNLIVSGYNDKKSELKKMTQWIASEIGRETPLHFTRFEPHYKMKKIKSTPLKTLEQAWKIAKESNLNHVYIGNVPGHNGAHTICPKCNKILIHRMGFKVIKETHNGKGTCSCGYQLPGIWSDK